MISKLECNSGGATFSKSFAIFSASVVKLRISPNWDILVKPPGYPTRPAPLSKHKYLESEREPVHCGLSGLLLVTMSIGWCWTLAGCGPWILCTWAQF
jgi:hypothetical protein